MSTNDTADAPDPTIDMIKEHTTPSGLDRRKWLATLNDIRSWPVKTAK